MRTGLSEDSSAPLSSATNAHVCYKDTTEVLPGGAEFSNYHSLETLGRCSRPAPGVQIKIQFNS